jgi:hypothetical protein
MALGLIGRILRRHSISARSRGSIIRQFAQKIGLVYFGVVDQHQDDHDVIRGLTVSTTHRDDHYAVGSFDGYDISLVDRFDIVMNHHGAPEEHSWVILQISLENGDELPHMFMKPNNHAQNAYTKFFNAYTYLKPVNGLFQGSHSAEFHSRYEVFMNASKAIEIEEILTPKVTHTIAARFWPHAIEIFEGKVYVYTTQTQLTETLLDTCLESALWLARTLDNTEEN